jgi:hypothetical protein|tara:strand:+ start:4478 stop:4699 length:222 start_codon:yes stop_codon:yes gene_type:complete
MKIYITFGFDHIHLVNEKILDKDTVAEIDCVDYKEGRKKAFKYFENRFATSYTKEHIDKLMHWFPNGIVKIEE